MPNTLWSVVDELAQQLVSFGNARPLDFVRVILWSRKVPS